jgi:Flp pilus assembly protein TadD
LKQAKSKSKQKEKPPQMWPVAWICVFLVAAVLAVFGQTARFGFINYDDQSYVYHNPVVQQGLTWKGVLWALTYGKIGHWHPLTWLTHMADFQLYGLWAGGHHLTNVALHAVTTVLLFLALRKMTGALWRSAFVAAVFAIHPLRAESVAWVAERKDVLSGMFFMLTLLAYVNYARRPSRGRYAMVAVWFGLGLLSKNMLVTLPFVLLLLDWWPLERFPASNFRFQIFLRLAKEKIPLLLLSAGSCIATFIVPEKVGETDRVPALERVGNALVSYVIYLRQMIFPAGLAIPYPNIAKGQPIWQVCLAFVALAAITAAVIIYRKKRPYLLTGWLWYLGMLVPAIGIVQISYYAHADRYTYLPEIGLAMAVTWAMADWSAKWKHRRLVMGSLMVAMISALAVCCHIQVSYWKDSESLWTHTLAHTSGNSVAHYNLGLDFAERGDLEAGIAQYRKAIEINPAYVEALDNLGNALVKQGRFEDGLAQYQKALEINPDFTHARYNLGTALLAEGNLDEAIVQYKEILENDPDDSLVRNSLGDVLVQQGKLDEAVTQYRKVLEDNPDDEEARFKLGNVLFNQGKLKEAIVQYRQVLEIKPDYAEAQNNLGTALLANGDTKEAIAQYRKALEIKPDYTEACKNLGNALLRNGDFDEAMACFQKVTPLSPDPLARWFYLGNIFLQKKNLDDAIACYRQALKINLRVAEAWANLGVAFFQNGESKETIDAWQKSLEIKPAQADVQNNLAWLLATSSDASLRNGPKAIALAEQARQETNGGNPMILRSLAAAYAEAGRFGDARQSAQEAMDLARIAGQTNLMNQINSELNLYTAGLPFHQKSE